MKLSKQEIAIIGVLLTVFVAIIVYGVFAFGGKEDKNVRHEFEAPEIVRNESKDDYNTRLRKELRTEPEKPKDVEEKVLLNPFSDEQEQQELTDSTELVAFAFIPEKEEKPKKDTSRHSANSKKKDKRTTAPKLSKMKTVPTVVISEEPEQIIEEVQLEKPTIRKLVTKQRYAQQTNAGLKSINSNLKASVYGQQKVYNKSLLKMRLLSPLVLSEEVVIPRNTFIYGLAQFSNERVTIQIKSITFNTVIYPVKYTVCDANDGLEGIFIGGDVINDVADKANTTLTSQALSSTSIGIISDIGQEVKTWTKKKSVTILNEHNLFLK